MSSIDISAQTLSFLYAIALGGALAVFYDFIKVLHRNFLSWLVLIQIGDVCFCLFSAFISFCFFMLVSNGFIRVYLLLGELFGFILWSLIFSSYFQKVLLFFFGLLQKFFFFLWVPFDYLSQWIKKFVISRKNTKKTAKNS